MRIDLFSVLSRRLLRRSFASDDELFLFITSTVVASFAIGIHLFLIIITAYYRQVPFVLLNIASLLVYCASLFLIKRKKYSIAILLVSIELSLYATIFSLLCGLSTYTFGYLLLVVILQVVLPYARVGARIALVLCQFALITICLLFSMHNPPAVLLPAAMEQTLFVSNSYILLIGAVIELSIVNIARIFIDKLKENRLSELTLQATTDALTGLYNRRYADAFFKSVVNASKQYCIAMLDIDDFKKVNDRYGHANGDIVLIFLADFLASRLRKSDIVFRWGGEEFLIALEGVGLRTAYDVLDKLRAELSDAAIQLDKDEIRITITIGVAELSSQNPHQSIKVCDKNLYIGKSIGKNVTIM